MKKRLQGKWRRLIARGLTFALFAPALCSCAADSGVLRESSGEAAFTRAEDQTAAAAAVTGVNDFAFQFSGTLLENGEAGENFLCSPYSVWLPLAALVNAADDEVRPQLLRAIGEAGLTEEELNAAASGMLYDLTAIGQNTARKEEGLEQHNPLQIADAVFVDQHSAIVPEFARTFAGDYGGSVIGVDFSSPEAADTVNAWAEEHTEGLITRIIDSFTPDTKAAIANAIYFSDRWHWEFDQADTKKDSFSAPAGKTEADFMLHEGEMSYYEDDELQAVRLSFVMGGSMIVLLPKEVSPEALLTSCSASRLRTLEDGCRPREGRLLLPRFEMESGVMNLNDALSAMDVPLFDPGSPGLSGLVRDEDLCISQAVQSAMIKVDEEGTTAAAVTMMALAGAALVTPTEPFEMICNRPFAFLLLGPPTAGISPVLFCGVVNAPQG